MHSDNQFSRRAFLRKLAASPTQPNTPPTPSEDNNTHTTAPLFTHHIAQIPDINPVFWSFSIGGLVERPLILGYVDVLAMSDVSRRCTLLCAGNTPGGSMIGSATWQGINVQTLLNELIIRDEVRYARLIAADGYVTALPLHALRDAILVHGMNGSPLTVEHGFPVRLIVPGRYGYKMPKWIKRIELTAYAPQGFWERRGWSIEGEVRPTVGFRSPHNRATLSAGVPHTFEGYAFVGNSDVSHIDLSVNDAAWMKVESRQADVGCMAEWSIDWTPPAPGHYQLRVRMDTTQAAAVAQHSIDITVEA